MRYDVFTTRPSSRHRRASSSTVMPLTGCTRSGRDLPQRKQHKLPPLKFRMGHRHRLVAEDETIVEENIQVDLPRAPSFPLLPPCALFDLFSSFSNSGGRSVVSISPTALRNFGWSFTPYGSVSYTDEYQTTFVPGSRRAPPPPRSGNGAAPPDSTPGR